MDDDDGSMINAKEDVSVVAAEREPGGSPEVTAVARIGASTPPKDTSGNIYEKPLNESINADEPGTQLFGGATDGQGDSYSD